MEVSAVPDAAVGGASGSTSETRRIDAKVGHFGSAFNPTHRWWWKAKLGDRHGQPCAVLARGKMNSILVAFADGHRVLTSRHAVRRI